MSWAPGRGPWSSIYIDPEYMSGPYWDARATTELEHPQPELPHMAKIRDGEWTQFVPRRWWTPHCMGLTCETFTPVG